MESNLVLIIDDREHAVYPHLETEAKGINYMKRRIEAGDYALVDSRNSQIIAVFERKSLKDFAASIKDGRYANKDKMLQLRSATNCSVIFIIEGPISPQSDKRFGNIPYKYIESAIFHMIIRDNISFIYTKDTLDTIQMLMRFISSTAKLLEKCEVGGSDDSVECLLTPDSQDADQDDDNQDADQDDDNQDTNQTAPKQVNIDALLQRVEKTTLDIARELWSCFRGITITTSDMFINRWSVRDAVDGKIADISGIKTPSGRAISKLVVKALTHIDKAVEIRLLSTIPGISAVTAKHILTGKTLRSLLSYEAEAIAITQISPAGKKLGLKRAEKIKECFEYTTNHLNITS